MRYNKNYTFGGFKLGARGKSSDKAYMKEAFEMNREKMERLYQEEMSKFSRPKDQADFVKGYPNAETLFTKQVQLYKDLYGQSMYKTIKMAIELRLGEEEERFRTNFTSGLEKFGLLVDLKKDLRSKGEKFDKNRIQYVGNAMYTYTAVDGTVYKYSVLTSPIQIIAVV